MTEHRIIGRDEWGARAVDHSRRQFGSQPRVWAHHFATDGWNGAHGMRECQDFHMDDKGWSDGAYSFCIDDDGSIFEMRGFGVAGGHTKGDNSNSHGIAFMGDYSDRPLPEAAQESAAWLLREGKRLGYWPEAKFDGDHRWAWAQGYCATNTQCAGGGVRDVVGRINFLASDVPKPAPKYTKEQIVAATADIDKIIEDTYSDAKRQLDEGGRRYWRRMIAFAPDPLAVYNSLRDALGLDVQTY